MKYRSVFICILIFIIFISFSSFSNGFNWVDYKDKFTNCTFRGNATSSYSYSCLNISDKSIVSNFVSSQDSVNNCPTIEMNFTLDKTYYMFKELSLDLESDTDATNPKYTELSLGNQVFTYSDDNLATACSSGSGHFIDRLRNASFIISEGFNKIRLKFACPDTDSCNAGNKDIVKIYEFNMTISDSINNLPQVNISAPSFLCINDTSDRLEIPLNISAYDKEGDQIYYSYKTNDIKDVLQVIDFNRQVCNPLYCMNTRNFDFTTDFMEVYRNRTYTTISPPSTKTEIVYNCKVNQTDDRSLTETDDYIYLPFYASLDRYVLLLSQNCVGYREFTMRFKNPLKYVFFSTQIYNLENGKYFNLSFFNHYNYTQINNIRFYRDNTRLLVYDYQNTLKINVSYTDPFEFSYMEYANNTNLVTISNTLNGIGYFNKSNTFFSSRYFSIYFENSLYIPKIYYSGISQLLDFKTAIPTSFNISGLGLKEYTLFYTDLENLNNVYNYTSLYTQIVKCDKYVEGVSIDKGFNPVKLTKDLLGKSLKDYLVKLDYYELGKQILWFLFIMMFLGYMLGQYLLTKQLDFTFPLFISSVSCLFLAFLVDYVPHLISFILLTAFALASPLAQHYGGKSPK